MSPSRSSDGSPWPLQTQHVSQASSSSSQGLSRKKRAQQPSRYARSSLHARQQIADQSGIDAAKARCENSDNSVISCWPTSNTRMNQGEFTQFVWNSRQPSFAQFGEVDIGLFRADTGRTVATFLRTPNPSNRAGSLPVQAGDPWWGSQGETFNGSSVAFPFYFVVVQSGQPLSGGSPQPTFSATQTTFATSVLAAMSSSSAAASASSAAAISSSLASLSSESSPPTLTSATTATSPLGSGLGDSGLQNSEGSSSFPHWAIAVITTLGFLALVAFIALIFLLFRRQRRRDATPSRRGSIGSQSPMMANVQSADGYPSSPPLGAIGAAGGSSLAGGNAVGRAGSTMSRDGASTHSDLPFTGADAAFMAEAFRAALRKPDFQGQTVEEGESPDAGGSRNPSQEEVLLSHHLAEEGKDIRSVSSSRGVKVETLNEEDDASAARNSHS